MKMSKSSIIHEFPVNENFKLKLAYIMKLTPPMKVNAWKKNHLK